MTRYVHICVYFLLYSINMFLVPNVIYYSNVQKSCSVFCGLFICRIQILFHAPENVLL
jgi:hypothetical protein